MKGITTTTAATTVDTINTAANSRSTKWLHYNNDAADTTLLDRKIEDATVGLRPEFSKLLHDIVYNDAFTIVIDDVGLHRRGFGR